MNYEILSRNQDQTNTQMWLEMYDPDKSILDPQVCLGYDETTLTKLFKEKQNEFKEALDFLEYFCKTRTVDSLEYSSCVVKAEKALESLKILKTCFIAMNILQINGEDIADMESHFSRSLEKMRKLQPEGETTLQLADIRMIKKFQTKPSQDFWKTSQDKYFCQPKASMMDLVKYFSSFSQKFNYQSVSVSVNREYFYDCQLLKGFHIIGFPKTRKQALFELTLYPSHSRENIRVVEERFHSWKVRTYQTLFWDAISLHWNKRVDDNMTNQIKEQSQGLHNLSEQFQNTNRSLKWKFSHAEVLTTEDQVALGIALHDAVMGDCLLLYHTPLIIKNDSDEVEF